jgi:glycosyltransferase involved in cell wall biosynthesis
MEAELRSLGMPVEPFQQPQELSDTYRQASALLLPSRLDHWGVVVHEAALCGCLLLVTRQCGSVDDLVEHGVNGYIMKKSSASEIRAAVAWLDALSATQLEVGRRRSIEKASQYSPRRWAETLELIEPKLNQCR